MNDRRDRQNLLDDILAEPGSGDFREALLSRTLRLATRRRALRQVRRAGSALAAVAALGLLAWWLTLPSPPPGHVNAEKPYLLVHSQPLPESALVETRPLGSAGLIASAPSENTRIIATRPEDRMFREIDDAALLALASATGTNAAVLVRLGPHSAQLVFVPEPVRED